MISNAPPEIAPHTSVRSERALIGAILVDPAQLDAVGPTVSARDFWDTDLAKLWLALAIIHDAGRPLDPNVLLPELARHDVPKEVRTASFLARLVDEGAPVVSSAPYYAAEIRRCSQLRELQQTLLGGLGKLQDRRADVSQVKDWLEAEVLRIARGDDNDVRSIAEVGRRFLDELRAPKDQSRVMTGIVSYDAAYGAWRAGELIVLAARTGMGKTALATQISMHQANRGRPSLYLSLEMPDTDWLSRVVSSATGIDLRRIRSGQLFDAEMASVEQHVATLEGCRQDIWAPGKATVAALRCQARHAIATRGLSLLVVDYLNLMTPEDKRVIREQQVAAISRGLKAVAMELQIPVLALCQLNRVADAGGPPRLSNLRESGAIEQDADIVMFVQREGDDDAAKLYVEKHRYAPRGVLHLQWDGSRTRFQ